MKQWHYSEEGKPTGSFTSAQIEEFFRLSKLNGYSLVWTEGMQQWQALSETEDFKHLLEQKLPPPLPPATKQTEAQIDTNTPMIDVNYEENKYNEDILLNIEESIQEELAGPWSRYFARIFDLMVINTFLFTATAVFFVYYKPKYYFELMSINTQALFILILPASYFVNALIISIFGNSAGKAMFAIKAVPVKRGRRLSFTQNIAREFRVWAFGTLFGIPLLSLITLIQAFKKVSNAQPTAYDEGRVKVLTYSSSKIRRTIGMLISIAVFFGIIFSNSIEAQVQRRTSLWTNPSTTIATTIPAGWQYENIGGANGETLYGFTNLTSGMVAMLGREQLPNQTISNYATGLEKTLSDSIKLEQWTRSEISNAWVTRGTTIEGNYPVKFYITNNGPVFWRVILIDQISSGKKDILEPAIVRSLFSSAGIP